MAMSPDMAGTMPYQSAFTQGKTGGKWLGWA